MGAVLNHFKTAPIHLAIFSRRPDGRDGNEEDSKLERKRVFLLLFCMRVIHTVYVTRNTAQQPHFELTIIVIE